MSTEIEKTILRIAEIIIDELKLEDITPQTFDPDLDLVDEVGIDSMDLATIAWFYGMSTVFGLMKMTILV